MSAPSSFSSLWPEPNRNSSACSIRLRGFTKDWLETQPAGTDARNSAGSLRLFLYGGAGSTRLQIVPLVTNSLLRPNRTLDRSFKEIPPSHHHQCRVRPGAPRG